MERRMLLALMLSLAVIIIYLKIAMPPQEGIAPTEAKATKVTPQMVSPTPVEKEPAIEKTERIGRSDIQRKLSTVYTKAEEITFSDVGGTIDKAVLKKSEAIKKGPIAVIIPLSPDVQPVTVVSDHPVTIVKDAVYELESGDIEGGRVNYEKRFGPLTVKKHYTVPGKGYVTKLVLELQNNSEKDVLVGPVDIGAGGIFSLDDVKGTHLGIDRMDTDGKVKRLAASKMEHEKRELASTRWLALRNQYFTVIIKPGVEAAGYFCAGVKEIDGLPGVRGGLILSEFGMRPGEVKDIAFDVYIGPKEMSALSDFGASEVINLGWFGFLGKWILVGLNAIYGLLGNYGLAIIVLTIIIRLILFPLNQKSFRSMSEMQKVQPRIAELQSKYKDDPKKKQQEMMKIYKEHGVNPMGGCLPMLLQFPILIAFFRVLQNAIELWGAPFVLWIKDLSEPDALFTIRTGGESAIPLIGRMINGEPCILLNILPLLMLLTFFIQQKMSTPGMATTPEQAQQQKMMKLMMPLMFGVIFYNMPAGLNLYFTVSTLLGIVQQKYMIR